MERIPILSLPFNRNHNCLYFAMISRSGEDDSGCDDYVGPLLLGVGLSDIRSISPGTPNSCSLCNKRSIAAESFALRCAFCFNLITNPSAFSIARLIATNSLSASSVATLSFCLAASYSASVSIVVRRSYNIISRVLPSHQQWPGR